MYRFTCGEFPTVRFKQLDFKFISLSMLYTLVLKKYVKNAILTLRLMKWKPFQRNRNKIWDLKVFLIFLFLHQTIIPFLIAQIEK